MRSFLFLQPPLTERVELFWLIPTRNVHKLDKRTFKIVYFWSTNPRCGSWEILNSATVSYSLVPMSGVLAFYYTSLHGSLPISILPKHAHWKDILFSSVPPTACSFGPIGLGWTRHHAKRRRPGTPREGQFVTPAAKGTGHTATPGPQTCFRIPNGNFSLDSCKGCMHDSFFLLSTYAGISCHRVRSYVFPTTSCFGLGPSPVLYTFPCTILDIQASIKASISGPYKNQQQSS